MYKAMIVDDEALARQLIKNLLKPFENELEVVAECADGFEAFKVIQELQPDVVFLDIQMPRINGFEMLELLDEPPAVIFITAFDEYALKAFEAHAVDYLLKPLTKERFETSVTKWLAQASERRKPSLEPLFNEQVSNSYQHRIVVKDNTVIRIIPWQDIQYIEASDDYIKIYTVDGRFLKKSTLGNVEKALDPQQFVRVHRSFLLPVSQLLKIEPFEKEGRIAILHCGARVPVSKSGMAKLKSLLGW